ncbi:MAG: SGNH/GDSL hydrolase family protein [Myxococcota bacterium]
MAEGTSRLRLLRFAIAFAAVVLSLALFEAGFRVKTYLDDRELDVFQHLMGDRVVKNPCTKVRTRNIIRLSSDRKIIFELIPGITATYKGAVIRVNRAGFRGPEIALQKPEGTLRIAGLGDSVMFGYGVGEDEVYLGKLVRRIAERYPGVSWEAINSGVPGYNTVMEVETLKVRVLPYRPDLVLLHFNPNDLALPNFIRNRAPYLSPRKSYLYGYIRTIAHGLRRAPDDRLRKPSADGVPAEYRDMVGLDAFRTAIQELAAIALRKGFRVLVLTENEFPVEIRQICEAFGFPLLEGAGVLRKYLREHDIEEYRGSPLVRSARDSHPSALAHRILAELLLDELERRGWLTELSQQALQVKFRDHAS